MRHGLAGRCHGQNTGQDWADAWRPAEGEGKAKQETAYHSREGPGIGVLIGLDSKVTEKHVAVEPASQHGPSQKNQRCGNQLRRPERSGSALPQTYPDCRAGE